ncbi:DegT/DnrJ/EryC1/StrS family aminotransferase [Marinobacter sp. SS21]|uniref:DegT/DnrJ/EryC1/StrS family aminotransferase n=1 Tax=Marinobacter sp. SS21 TaxID=2979460 RepID=UPI00232B8F7E|nr:DegT/DnrJ/EryC1/StrS family aminotransferase [Marinobacter sp. SS21]MDC0661936.1 DegT/DnrJ/EryC1/StrS family aminotransferase [Marinobacter sp. SS21]
MIAKLRPVGSKVAVPGSGRDCKSRALPWSRDYLTVFTNSGTAALSWAVSIAKSGKPNEPAPEVLVSAYGCPDLVAAIVAQGAIPVLVDLEPDQPRLDIDQVRSAINHRTVALIAVDFLGLPEDLAGLARLCQATGIALIEDAAQMFPPASSHDPFADFVVLSFGRGKPVNLLGGGALLIRRAKGMGSILPPPGLAQIKHPLGLAWHVKRWLFNVLLSRWCYGVLSRIPAFGVGLTRFQPLTRIEQWCLKPEILNAGLNRYWSQNLLHRRYDAEFQVLVAKGWALLQPEFGAVPEGDVYPRLRYALLAPNQSLRDRVLKALNNNGIGANALYEKPLTAIDGVAPLLRTPLVHYPSAQKFADRLITLPTHEDVSDVDLHTIVRTVKQIAGAS